MLAVTDAPTRYYYANQRIPGYVKNALAARYAEGGNTWQNNQQAGVAYRELAISQLLLHPKHPERAIESFNEALEYFAAARELAELDMLAHACIDQDAILTQAYMAQAELTPERFTDRVWYLLDMLLRVESQLTGLTASDDVAHALMITLAFRGRLHLMIGRGAQANNAFWKAMRHKPVTTPDDEKAYRSMLCYWALGLRARGGYDFGASLNRVDLVLESARKYKDRAHTLRAMAIFLFGQRGENLLRRLRDRGC